MNYDKSLDKTVAYKKSFFCELYHPFPKYQDLGNRRNSFSKLLSTCIDNVVAARASNRTVLKAAI